MRRAPSTPRATGPLRGARPALSSFGAGHAARPVAAPWRGPAPAPHRPAARPTHTDRATRYRNTFANQTLPSGPVYG
ncbi:hypothetical protein C0L86_06870 [Streptomyces sp. SCA2-2]|nr:hypothetical protein C0L86_06870 [Streptomyces sp. SCA2-2]